MQFTIFHRLSNSMKNVMLHIMVEHSLSLQTDLLDKAIVDLQQTIEIQPFAPHAYYKLAHVYAKLKNLEKSLANYSETFGI